MSPSGRILGVVIFLSRAYSRSYMIFAPVSKGWWWTSGAGEVEIGTGKQVGIATVT